MDKFEDLIESTKTIVTLRGNENIYFETNAKQEKWLDVESFMMAEEGVYSLLEKDFYELLFLNKNSVMIKRK